MSDRDYESVEFDRAEGDFIDDPNRDDEVEQAWERFKRTALSRRTLVLGGLVIVILLAFIYGAMPQLPGLQNSLDRVKSEGDRDWLALAFVLELLSYFCYIWFFRAVFVQKVPRIGWRGSYRISMAGVAATRLFGAAGAGGIALTFWAIRRAGMGRRRSASHLIAFYVILYVIFMLTLLLGGVLLRTGVVAGAAPFGVTVVPAIFALLVMILMALMLFLPGDLERIATRWAHGRGRIARIAGRVSAGPSLIGEGTRLAFDLLRGRNPGLLGALGWWAFDIATLWACFKAFGDTPELAVLIMGYFVGMVANTIPTPGGIGAVEGGMIGAYAAFGVNVGLAVTAVVVYRLFAFIMPTIPGLIAFVRLRRAVSRWQDEDATIQSKVLSPGSAALPQKRMTQ